MNFLTESTAPPAFSSRSLECKRIFFSPSPSLRAARAAGEVISHGLAAHLHCTASPSRSHCERGSKIRKLPLPNGYFLVYFTGAPGKTLFERRFPVALLYLLHTGGMEVSRFVREQNDRLCATRLVCIMSFLPMRSHTMPCIAGKQTEHKRAILWLFTVQERCERKQPPWNLSALLHRVAFVDVRTAIKDKCLRACVHIDATTQALLMHRF